MGIAPFQQPLFELFHPGRARRLIQLLRLDLLLFKVFGLGHPPVQQQQPNDGLCNNNNNNNNICGHNNSNNNLTTIWNCVFPDASLLRCLTYKLRAAPI
eukprot:jgi/Psemu1/47651/gm1.47651_g